MPTYTTACPRNCYSTCSFKVTVENEKIISIEPHASNQATPEGPCIKGLAYVERAHSEDRILTPQLKGSDGNFQPISWEEALNLITDKLQHYKNSFGSQSVFFYAASGMSGLLNSVSHSFWDLYGGVTTTYGNLCWPAGLEATRLTLGANKHNPPWDLEHARLIVLWGKNPVESNIQEMIHIDKALEKGAKLVTIDPRRSPSCERGQYLIQLKPGTDAALALGVAHELIRNNWIDRTYIDKYVVGFDDFARRAAEYPVNRVSQICDIPEESIRLFAKLIDNNPGMTMIPGYGMQRFSNGGQSIRSILALSVITGNIGKKGACWHYANLQSYVFDSLKEPLSYFPKINAKPKFRRAVSMAKLGDDLYHLVDPEIKMIWVERGNPLTQNPDSKQVKKAFQKAEFRVVVDQFITDTAQEANLILPAKNMFEQSDIIGSYWNPYVQLKQKVIEPAGEVKPETEIYYLLAQKLGFAKEHIENYFPAPNDEAIEAYLNKHLKAFPELSLEKLKQGPLIASQHEDLPFADGIFNTPSRKIELYSTEAEKLWSVDPLPDYVPLERSDYPLQLMSPNSKNRIHSQFGNLNVIKQFEPETLLFIHPTDAENRDVNDGELVQLYNDKGSSEVKICFDMGLKSGCVVLTNGHWYQDGSSPNLFTKGKETDMGHGTAFHDTYVDCEKIASK